MREFIALYSHAYFNVQQLGSGERRRVVHTILHLCSVDLWMMHDSSAHTNRVPADLQYLANILAGVLVTENCARVVVRKFD